MNYLRHPAWLWLEKHDKTKLPPHDAATMAMFASGYKFEDVAEKLFPEALKLGWDSYNEYKQLATVTKAVLDNPQGARTIIQAKFETDELACISDVVHIDGKQIDLYEIKSSTSVKKEHILDLAFQCEVIRRCGYEIRSVTVLTVNNQYVRKGDIDPELMVDRDDVTVEVIAKRPLTDIHIAAALEVASEAECPNMSFSSLGVIGSVGGWAEIIRFNTLVPNDSVLNLVTPGKNRLVEFEKNNIKLLTEIPESISLTAKQELQVLATKSNRPIINHDAIKAFLNELQYPLYFLDYETYSAVVPYFDGHRPYIQVPFQYSLHILDSPDGELLHEEYLQTENSECTYELSEALKAAIGDSGSVITWNMGFERSCNTTMGELSPSHTSFFENLNKRIVDLCIPFKDDMYVDKSFKGSYSIKKVLPVLVPEPTYAELEIKDGGTAQTAWMRAVLDQENNYDKAGLFSNLRKYCALDTYAMVEIYRILKKL